MICPFCNSDNTTCFDTRQMPHYRRRRYKCRNCEKRFTTKEWVELKEEDDDENGA